LVDESAVKQEDVMFSFEGNNGDAAHAWIEIGSSIIDISIDQFFETSKFIYDIDSLFHKTFKGQTKYSYDEAMQFNDYYRIDFENNYRNIINVEPGAAGNREQAPGS